MRRLFDGGGATASASLWHPQDVPYPRLLQLDLRARGPGQRAGVYLVWHLGVRPRWLRAGGAANLDAALRALTRRPEIASSDANGGVFVAWAFLTLEQIPAAVGSLAARLRPALQRLVQRDEMGAGATSDVFPLPPGSGPAVPPATDP